MPASPAKPGLAARNSFQARQYGDPEVDLCVWTHARVDLPVCVFVVDLPVWTGYLAPRRKPPHPSFCRVVFQQ